MLVFTKQWKFRFYDSNMVSIVDFAHKPEGQHKVDQIHEESII